MPDSRLEHVEIASWLLQQLNGSRGKAKVSPTYAKVLGLPGGTDDFYEVARAVARRVGKSHQSVDESARIFVAMFRSGALGPCTLDSV